MNSSYQIGSGSTIGSLKKRNGDPLTVFRSGSGPQYLGLMLADGVGSTSTDWLASSTACERFAEIGQNLTEPIANPEQWLADAVQDIDDTLAQSPQLLLCAATLLIWEIGTDACYFANIGDTRLYQVGRGEPVQISTDESKAVIRRGSDGKPLYSVGSVVVQRGIKQALGSGQVSPNIQSCSYEPGEALILSSDGFYGDKERFSHFTEQVRRALDLESTVAGAIQEVEGGNDDDASTLVIRRNGEAIPDEIVGSLLEGATLESEFPPHALFSNIEKRLSHWIAQKDETAFLRGVDYLSGNMCLIPKKRIDAVTKQLIEAGWDTQRYHAQLQIMARRHYDRL